MELGTRPLSSLMIFMISSSSFIWEFSFLCPALELVVLDDFQLFSCLLLVEFEFCTAVVQTHLGQVFLFTGHGLVVLFFRSI